MMRALSTAGTGMVAQQYNLDVISNNLANVNTTGFKGQRAEFQDVMYQTSSSSGSATGGSSVTPLATQVGLGTMFSASDPDLSSGPLTNTGNSLDLAIVGNGFFQVELPDGSTAYTRDGSFKRNANGLLVTSDGYTVLPQVTIPTDATSITVSSDGKVEAVLAGQNDVTLLGTVQIAAFPNPAGLTRMGQNLFKAGGGSGTAVVGNPGENGTGTLQSGFLEGSNVQVVEEMVRMIAAQRSYEINSKAVQSSDEMLQTLANLKR